MASARYSEVFREVHPGASPSPALDDALARALAAGRAAWPAIAVDERALVRYLAERVGPGEDASSAIDALHASDLHLACACAAGSTAALEAFSRHMLSDLGASLSRVGAAALAEDVRQILLERLFVGSAESPPKIGAYAGRGQLAAW